MKTTHTAEQIDAFSALAAKNNRERIATLVPIVLELARKAGSSGVTVSDLRLTAVQRAILPAQSAGRELSFLGAVMKAAGLKATSEVRRSVIAGSNGNRHTVWILPAKEQAA